MITLFVFAAAWAAFVVSAVAGGGAGLVLVPLLRMLIPIASVPAALSIGTAASSISRIATFRRSIRWDVVRRFVPTALPGAAIGAAMLSLFEPSYVELIIAAFLLANLPALFRKPKPAAAVPMPLNRLPLIGALAGLLSGFTGAVGLLFNGAYQRLGMTRQEIVATRATNEVLLHILKIAIYAGFGLLDQIALAAGALVAAAAVLAAIAMRWLLPLLHEGLFRRIGQLAMVAAGAAMFMLSSAQIAAIHRAWFAVVAPDGEYEVRLHWGGEPRIAAEAEPEGYLALERAITIDALPPSIRKAALEATARDNIRLVEEVWSLRGRSYEIYFVENGRSQKIELR